MLYIDRLGLIEKSKKNFTDPYVFSPKGKFIIKLIFIPMLGSLLISFFYCALATQAIRDDSVYFFMPWLEYSRLFVMKMAQFVPIINHIPDSGDYPDYYIELYQNIYAVTWFIIFFCMFLAFIQIFILQWEMRLEKNYLDIKNCLKLMSVSTIFIFFLIHSEFIGTLSLSMWPIFSYFSLIMILLSFYGIGCGLLRIIMTSLVYLQRSIKNE